MLPEGGENFCEIFGIRKNCEFLNSKLKVIASELQKTDRECQQKISKFNGENSNFSFEKFEMNAELLGLIKNYNRLVEPRNLEALRKTHEKNDFLLITAAMDGFKALHQKISLDIDRYESELNSRKGILLNLEILQRKPTLSRVSPIK